MERRRLKTIMILILILTNGFLSLWLIQRYMGERMVRKRIEERLTALFELDGMTLYPEAMIPQTPCVGVSLRRDEELEVDMASFFLGGRVRYTEDDGIRNYVADTSEVSGADSSPDTSTMNQSPGGSDTDSSISVQTLPRSDGAAVTVRFDNRGGFLASGLSVREDAADFCLDFCRRWHFDVPESFDMENGTVTTCALYGDIPVVNCHVRFVFRERVLREVSGTALSQEGIPLQTDTMSLSAIGALTVFQTRLREHRAVMSAVKTVRPCLLLTGGQTAVGTRPEVSVSADAPLTLDPGWRIVTDTVSYHVNGLTEELSPDE